MKDDDDVYFSLLHLAGSKGRRVIDVFL
jgi:hypothetical protein